MWTWKPLLMRFIHLWYKTVNLTLQLEPQEQLLQGRL